jgi:hypothetical protein
LRAFLQNFRGHLVVAGHRAQQHNLGSDL